MTVRGGLTISEKQFRDFKKINSKARLDSTKA